MEFSLLQAKRGEREREEGKGREEADETKGDTEMRVTEVKGEWKSGKNDGGGAWQSAKLSLEFIEIHDGCEGGRGGR